MSSILPGYTQNPYDTSRVTAGSSGGSAAGVAANFGAVGLASDTGNSIRGPAAHQALVGIRSTMGLMSRAGVVPLNLAADIAGADRAHGRRHGGGAPGDRRPGSRRSGDGVAGAITWRPNYAASLRPDGLKGARIGVLHQAYDTPTLDREVDAVFSGALGELQQPGRRGRRPGRRSPGSTRCAARRAAAATSSSTT